jgi:MFS family permease
VRRTELFIFVTVFVDMLGYGIIVPLLPLFVERQASGGAIVGVLTALYALAQAVGGPFLCSLSDRYGRRPLLLGCLAGTALAYLLLGAADTLALVAAAMLLDGITGGNLSIAQAYIADTTPPADRAARFGIVSVAFGVGLMAGPAVSGVLSAAGLSAPAYAAAGLAFANLLFGFVVLPESLPAAQRAPVRLSALNPLGALGGALRSAVRGLLLTLLLVNLAFAGLQIIFPLFSRARFGWDASANAFFYAFVGVCAVITQALLLPRLVRRFGERRLALAGIALMAAGLALVAAAPDARLLYPIVGMLAFGANLSIPALSALLSARSAPAAQGQAMASLQIVINAALIGGPLLAGFSFDLFGPGAPFLAGAVIACGAFVVCLRSGIEG